MAITPEEARAELMRRKQAAAQSSPPEEEQNSFQKAMRYGIQDPAIGLLNMGREFANIPHKLSRGKIPEFSPSDYDFGKTLGVSEPSSVDNLIQGITQYGPSMAIPGLGLGRAGQMIGKIPKAGRFISRAISEAIPQGLYSASQAPKDHALKSGVEASATMTPFSVATEAMLGAQPWVRNLVKGLVGTTVGLGARHGAKELGFGETGADIAGISGAILGGRGLGTKKEMMNRLTEGVDLSVAQKRLDAAKRLGLDYLTPAEAGVSPWAARQQGSLGKTPEGGKMLYEKGLDRQKSERESIGKTLDMIYSPKMDKEIDAAYKSISPVNLPTEFPLQYKDNAIINAAERRVKAKPAYQESLKKMLPESVKLKEGQVDIEPTSLVYWDHVKRALYDMEKEASRKGSGSESNILGETRRDLVSQMDAHFPEYAEARNMYELKKTRQGLEKVFDQKEITGTNFYRALASEKKFDELIGHLKNAPEAKQNLQDMRLLFKDLMGPPTIKTAKGTEERGMFQERNPGDYIKQLFEHIFTKGGNDKAAIEFITSPDWHKQLQEINKISDKQARVAAMGMALSRGVAQYAGQSN